MKEPKGICPAGFQERDIQLRPDSHKNREPARERQRKDRRTRASRCSKESAAKQLAQAPRIGDERLPLPLLAERSPMESLSGRPRLRCNIPSMHKPEPERCGG